MTSKSLADTSAIARQFAEGLEPAAADGAGKPGATVVALSGDLGSGKTTFAKSFAAVFGIAPEDVTSPTFVIEKRFPIQGSAYWKNLIHIDAYRLEGARDVERLRWAETVADSSNLVLVEWPEKMGDALPASAIRIEFRHRQGDIGEGGEGERAISFI